MTATPSLTTFRSHKSLARRFFEKSGKICQICSATRENKTSRVKLVQSHEKVSLLNNLPLVHNVFASGKTKCSHPNWSRKQTWSFENLSRKTYYAFTRRRWLFNKCYRTRFLAGQLFCTKHKIDKQTCGCGLEILLFCSSVACFLFILVSCCLFVFSLVFCSCFCFFKE